jgi:carbohydrate-selective porin OprB
MSSGARGQTQTPTSNVRACGLTYELVLEWTYAIALGHRLTIQRDVQYVINLGGVSSVGNAVVLGMRIAIEF